MNSGQLISASEAVFLNLHQLPACLNVEQTAALLGRRPEHVTIMIEGGFLTPLGDPPKNGIKLFAACDILEKAKDLKWLDKANKHLTRHWQNRNAKTKKRGVQDSQGAGNSSSQPLAAMRQAKPLTSLGHVAEG